MSSSPSSKKRTRAVRKSAREAEARKRQIVVRYAEDGTRIGDDGYPMTKARKRLHNTCNVLFVLMCLCFVAAAVCIINSYFQNQTITDWELIWIGGNMFHGQSVGTLLRIEALFLLYLTAIFLFANQRTMAWMYDGRPKKSMRTFAMLMIVPPALYFIGFGTFAGIPDPASIISIVMGVLILRFAEAVERERGKLKKAKVAREEIKK